MSDSASIWQAPTTGTIPVVNTNGSIFEEVQVAILNQTVFTLATFSYTPGSHSIFVWKNGLMLRRAVDYVETDSTHVTVSAPCAAGDKLWFVAIAINQLIAPVVFNGMPSGGTAGQLLTKTNGSDYQATWTDPNTVTTLLDAARVNIASASTVNLSAIAATTRNIMITGGIQIDGFQVTNGQVWIAKFASSLILKNNANIATNAGQDIKVSPGDTCIIRATVDNIVEIIAYARASSSLVRNLNDFRLTLTTGLPVTTADVVAASTIYCTPYKGNKISLYNGVSWVMRESAEFSIALAGLINARPYDVFAFDNAGVPALEILAWATDTARGTLLAVQDGVQVKFGDATRKYIGTFYTTSATSTEDSVANRYLWNYYNRVGRKLYKGGNLGSWSYAVGVARQANGSASNQVNFVCGIVEDPIPVCVSTAALGAGASAYSIGIGLNSTTTFTDSRFGSANTTVTLPTTLQSEIVPAAGKSFIAWLEMVTGASAITFYGLTDGYIVGQIQA